MNNMNGLLGMYVPVLVAVEYLSEIDVRLIIKRVVIKWKKDRVIPRIVVSFQTF